METLVKCIATILSFIIFTAFVGLLSSCITFWTLPPSIPVFGAKNNGHLSRTKAYINAWLSYHRSRANAYTELSKAGTFEPFISPSPSLSPDIVIPPEHVRWLLNQPNSVLAQRPALWEGMAIKYMFPSANPDAEFVPGVVKKHMAPAQVDGILHRDIYREIKYWIDLRLGTGSGSANEWTEVSLFEATGFIQKRVGYRLYFGDDLGRNEELIDTLQKLSNWAAVGGLIIGQFSPFLLRRPIGLLFRVPIGYYTSKFRGIWEPAMRDRVASIHKGIQEKRSAGLSGEAERSYSYSAMNAAAEALAGNRRHSVESISTNFLIMYGIASNVKVPGSLALLLNLITLPSSRSFLPFLRNEVDHVFSSKDAWEDPRRFTPERIPLTTAFMRESMRYSPLAANIPVRTVVAKEGVILPDGTHVPRGGWLVCPTESMTMDERFYTNPQVFDPFRFLDEIDEKEEKDDEERGKGEAKRGINKRYSLKEGNDLTSATESFLFYGFGRHCCPGRFFMARMMVVMLTYIVKNYDFKPGEGFETPVSPTRAGFVNLPPLRTRVRFRRRMPNGES